MAMEMEPLLGAALVPKKNTDIIAIDEEVKEFIGEDPEVANFLEALQTTHIGRWSLNPTAKFYITVVAFLLPAIYSSLTVVFQSSSSAPKLFFDDCINTTNGTTILPYDVCLSCNGGRPYVLSNATKAHDDHEDRDRLKLITIVVSVFSVVIAGAIFSRLTVMEFLAIRFLSYGVVIQTKFSCMQLLPFFIVLFLLLACAGLDVAVAVSYAAGLHSIELSNANMPPPFDTPCAGNIVAHFEKENPSLTSDSVPDNTLDYVKAVFAAILPFFPVILSIWKCTTTSFTMLGLEDLMTDARLCLDLFDTLYYECDEHDLVEALEEYSHYWQREKLAFMSLVRRIIMLDFDFSSPPSMYFTQSWGKEEEHSLRLFSLMKAKKHLRDYKPKELKTADGKKVEAGDIYSQVDDDDDDEEEEEEQKPTAVPVNKKK